MNVNKAIIVGRLTKAPELKALPSGTKVVTFSVATSEKYKDKNSGKEVENTEFHNIVAFGKVAEIIAQYVIKGQEIYIEGKIKTRSWEDKNTKEKKYRTEITLDQFQFGAKPKDASTTAPKPKPVDQDLENYGKDEPVDTLPYPDEDINAEDIPF